jgi:hypothetical protein
MIAFAAVLIALVVAGLIAALVTHRYWPGSSLRFTGVFLIVFVIELLLLYWLGSLAVSSI